MQDYIIPQEKALEFIIGGNALFTVKSLKTEKRYTFKVLQDRKIENRLKVSVLSGPDNTSNYKEFGEINVVTGMAMFKNGNYSFDKDYAKVFDHIFINLCIGLFMPSLEIYHSGRCCKCGRLLTVPESIASGIGPECAFRESLLKTSMYDYKSNQ